MSFQCSILSVPTINNNTILFKSQAVEFNGKNHTEIPITCISSIYDTRMITKINKLQKGNKIEIIGNLIKNDEELIVSIMYLVYANTNNYTTFDKNDLTKIPWLDSSNLTKKIMNKDEDKLKDLNNNLPNFIVNQHANNNEIDNTEGKRKF